MELDAARRGKLDRHTSVVSVSYQRPVAASHSKRSMIPRYVKTDLYRLENTDVRSLGSARIWLNRG